MKKWLILFVGSLYIYLPVASLQERSGFVWPIIIVMIVSGCFNMANAVIMQRNPNDETGLTMKFIMISKLCMLPVYAFCFLVFAATVLFALSIWFTIPALFMLPGVIGFSYFVLFVTSSLAVSRIIILCRRGVLSLGQCVFHVILQLFFVLDVIDCIIVYTKERKTEG